MPINKQNNESIENLGNSQSIHMNTSDTSWIIHFMNQNEIKWEKNYKERKLEKQLDISILADFQTTLSCSTRINKHK